MPSHSSYIYNGSSNGLGQMMVSSTARNFYDRQRNLQPVLLPVRESGRSTIDSGSPTRTIKPIVATIAPKTGGSHPIIDPVLKPDPPVVTSTTQNPAPWVRMDGSTVVINGRHHVEKRHLALIGGGLFGAALLYKLIL
jgi:hypothetical protein